MHMQLMSKKYFPRNSQLVLQFIWDVQKRKRSLHLTKDLCHTTQTLASKFPKISW